MAERLSEMIRSVPVPIGTRARLDRLIVRAGTDLDLQVKSRSGLIRLILLDGIADLERDCASLRGALVLKYREHNEQP